MKDIISIIAGILKVSKDEICDIRTLKKGMTNQSFLFSFDGNKYIFRLPGAGTENLLNRQQEMNVYKAIENKGICRNPVYIDESGYKITRFIENARVCNPGNLSDVKQCIEALKKMHELRLHVDHVFDIYEQIEKYEKLWGDNCSLHDDYRETKENTLSLKEIVSSVPKEFVLTHIDAVPDNFLLSADSKIELIDWEYAGMQDPHVDIAMFAIYAFYDKTQIDALIDIYFEGKCPHSIRTKIYCYISLCGLLWSNWCEYKHILGYNFGDYSDRQYNYAKEFYEIAMKEASTNV